MTNKMAPTIGVFSLGFVSRDSLKSTLFIPE